MNSGKTSYRGTKWLALSLVGAVSTMGALGACSSTPAENAASEEATIEQAADEGDDEAIIGECDGATVYLVRHGETIFNSNHLASGWSDSPLTPEGEEQALATGEALADLDFDSVLMSDLGRTRQTAALVLEGAGSSVEPTPVPELREFYFGGFEGQPDEVLWGTTLQHLGLEIDEDSCAQPGNLWTCEGVAEFMQNVDVADLYDAIAASDPMGLAEDSATNDARMNKAMDIIEKEIGGNECANILVVSHGMTIGGLATLFEPSINGGGGQVGNGSVTTLKYRDGEFALEGFAVPVEDR